jgi:hypothetical protein
MSWYSLSVDRDECTPLSVFLQMTINARRSPRPGTLLAKFFSFVFRASKGLSMPDFGEGALDGTRGYATVFEFRLSMPIFARYGGWNPLRYTSHYSTLDRNKDECKLLIVCTMHDMTCMALRYVLTDHRSYECNRWTGEVEDRVIVKRAQNEPNAAAGSAKRSSATTTRYSRVLHMWSRSMQHTTRTCMSSRVYHTICQPSR